MRAALAAITAAGLLALSACSSSGSDPSAAPTTAPWSPCDGLTPASVGRLVGAAVTEANGSVASPRCTFAPVTKGGAAYDVSYLWFDGGLDAALDAMGATGAQLKPIDVAGADAARLVVSPSKTGVLVTGFVQTGGLVQSVNAAQLPPYDEQQVVTGTKALLAELARQAPASPSG
ncbi:hypothetical protein [Nocardioides sp. URHA0020]|uniref:hypothetical protein n=1 Tax=Nocardioides sp. URHA0020 TaxID=1380392 RepID=UPI00048F4D3D|nr:hypothetical protein [Nocardioides sp. URHA0020]